MRAARLHGRGDLRIEEVPHPGPPGPGEALLEVRRVAICGTDASEWQHGPRLTRPPVILGHEFTGVLSALGDGVEGFAVGQRVVSGAGVWCGRCGWCAAGRTNLCEQYRTLGLQVDGALADFVRVPAETLVAVSDTVSDDAAALAQPLAVALHAVRRSGVAADDTLVVVGVGGIGAFIVAAAVARGVRRIIAVDVAASRLAIATPLGASEVIDVSGRDLAAAILERIGDGADVVIEASGAAHAPAAALAATRRGGRVLLVGHQAAPRELDLFSVAVREIDVLGTQAHVCQLDLPDAVAILATTDIAAVVVDRVLSLDELLPHGIKALLDGTARGKVLVDPRRG